MKNKSFEYKGVVFEAYKNVKNRAKDAHFQVMQKCTKSDITPEGYDYYEFYKIAKKHGAYTDLYKVNGRVCIPSLNLIFYYDERN